MKTLFVHASVNTPITLPADQIKKLPKKLGIFTTIQFLRQLPKMKQQLEAMGKDVTVIGQTLGCRADAAENADVDAFLYIGSGRFHPLLVAYKSDKPVYCYHPLENKVFRIEQADINEYHKQRKANLLTFLHAKRVGILITTKIGQNDNKINTYSEELKMKGALELLTRADKEYYLFAFDTLEIGRLEDFNFIDCWVNTACSRIVDAKGKIVNLDDVRELYADTDANAHLQLKNN